MWPLIRAEFSYRGGIILFWLTLAAAFGVAASWKLVGTDDAELGPFLMLFVPHVINAVGMSQEQRDKRLALYSSLPLPPWKIAIARILSPVIVQCTSGLVAMALAAFLVMNGEIREGQLWVVGSLSGFLLLTICFNHVYFDLAAGHRGRQRKWKKMIGFLSLFFPAALLYLVGLFASGYSLNVSVATEWAETFKTPQGVFAIHWTIFCAILFHIWLFRRRRDFTATAETCSW